MSERFPYRDFTEAIAELDRQTDIEAQKRFHERRKTGVLGTVCKSIGCFWNEYVGKKGYKDGVLGLFLAVNAGMHEFLSFAKTWELYREGKKDG